MGFRNEFEYLGEVRHWGSSRSRDQKGHRPPRYTFHSPVVSASNTAAAPTATTSSPDRAPDLLNSNDDALQEWSDEDVFQGWVQRVDSPVRLDISIPSTTIKNLPVGASQYVTAPSSEPIDFSGDWFQGILIPAGTGLDFPAHDFSTREEPSSHVRSSCELEGHRWGRGIRC